MQKINWKKILIIGYWFLIVGLLVYTRFINLSWGLPFPMHPDERNMANAVQNLNCNIKYQISNIKDCFNPHFFAYGQFPLYLGYIVVLIIKIFNKNFGLPISFEEATVALRIISAIASVINFIVIIKIIKVITKEKSKNSQLLNYLITPLLVIFSPFFIQFSHFGTTESLLMLFYSLIVYYCLKLINISDKVYNHKKIWKLVFLLGLISGMSVATKVSALIFVVIAVLTIFWRCGIFTRSWSKCYRGVVSSLGLFLAIFLFSAVIFSPHNLISNNEFFSSLRYESQVATGALKVFYTRQFENTIPVVFQLTKIFPYALGWMIFILGVLGYLGILGDWRDQKINLLRLAFLIYFIPNAFLFTKWTRFMAPVFPLMLIFAILTIEKIKIIKIIKIIIVIITILPGTAYLSVYQNPDVRFVASEWIYKNIPVNSYILSETANVIDIPLPIQNSKFKIQNYYVISFNFYDLDENKSLQEELKYYLGWADYIFVPSRRIFKNHTCLKEQDQKSTIKIQSQSLNLKTNNCSYLKEKYPIVNQYYEGLFSEKLGFRKVAEINSFPKIQFRIYNSELKIEFPDEEAEETWTVFDHPVIRIYRRNHK